MVGACPVHYGMCICYYIAVESDYVQFLSLHHNYIEK